jgi:hypothetical protein
MRINVVSTTSTDSGNSATAVANTVGAATVGTPKSEHPLMVLIRGGTRLSFISY